MLVGTYLEDQWLSFLISNEGGTGWIYSWGTKLSQAMW